MARRAREVKRVTSLEDKALPAGVSGLYIGGGFPEVFARELQANESFRESVRASAEDGMAVWAECGGLMYMARTLRSGDKTYNMAGVFPADVQMETERQGHGYAMAVANGVHPWLPEGTVLKGHEHHHSRVVHAADSLTFSLDNTRGRGILGKHDGVCHKRCVAGYLHVNAIASPEWAPHFVAAAQAYQAAALTPPCQ